MICTQSDIILEIKNLSCGYGDKPIILGFSLQLFSGETLAITGPNGCGKSTLLKAIYQLCKVNEGSITFKGRSLVGKTPEQVKGLGIAWFMQKNAVFTKLTVKENLQLALNGLSRLDKKIKTEEIVVDFPGLRKWLNKTAGLLSGGQRQQLAFAMLVSQDADLWLLDEPTAGLDLEKTNDFIDRIKQLSLKIKPTIIIVEHKLHVINQLKTKSIQFKNCVI